VLRARQSSIPIEHIAKGATSTLCPVHTHHTDLALDLRSIPESIPECKTQFSHRGWPSKWKLQATTTILILLHPLFFHSKLTSKTRNSADHHAAFADQNAVLMISSNAIQLPAVE